jgi:hypothetical protein
VDDGAVLNIRAAANSNAVDIAANDDGHPNAALLAHLDVADDLGAVVDVSGWMDARQSSAMGTEHVGLNYIEPFTAGASSGSRLPRGKALISSR